MEQSPLKNFQTKIGQLLFRMSFITQGATDVSHFTQDHSKGYCYEQTFTLDTLPKDAITIFFDIRTLYDYIIDNHSDVHRVKLLDDGLMVCNIIKVKATQRRQQVMLHMTKVPLNKLVGVSKLECYENPQTKAQMYQLLTKNAYLTEESTRLRQEMEALKKISQTHEKTIKLLLIDQNNKKQKQLMKTNMQELKTKIELLDRQSGHAIKQIRVEQRYLLEIINKLQRELATQKNQKQQLREIIKDLRESFKRVKQMPPPSSGLSTGFKGDVLGQRVTVTLDKENVYLNKFKIQGSQIQKIKDDQTRFQILGNELMGKAARSYFEVRIIKLANGNLLLGFVSQSRKGQRHSYDQKECVCFQGTGKIFEMGRRSPAIAKLQAGQIVRIVLDLQASLVRWMVGFTEIGSALIPQALKSGKIVPYIELNEVGDKIGIN